MNEPTIDNVVQRMDRLERENRRMKLVGVLVLLGIAAVMVMGQAKAPRVARVIEAERFVLRDENGRERATLEVESISNLTSFTLRDKDATVNFSLIAGKDFVRVGLNHINGSSLNLSLMPKFAGLEIYDRDRKKRVSVNTKRKEGIPTAGIGILDKDGNPLIALFDNDGSGVMSLVRRGDKDSALVFLEEGDGGKRIELASTKDDPFIRFYDKYKTIRAALGTIKGTPIIAFTDELGKSVWGRAGNRLGQGR